MALNPHMVTVSGRSISLYSPKAADIDLDDMAHHLAMNNRYNGATRTPYVVAQHSELVAEILKARNWGPVVQFYGLIHDAPEYVTGDFITPMKQALFGETGLVTDLDEIEAGINQAIWRRFDIAPPTPSICELVKTADRIAFATEWRDLMPKSVACPMKDEPSPRKIVAYPWQLAKHRFIATFQRLARECHITIPDVRAFA